MLGLTGSGILIATIPLLTELLALSELARGLAGTALLLGAASLFLTLQSSVASSSVRALERFDLVSRVTLWAALWQALAAVLVLRLGYSLVGVLSTGLAVQLGAVVARWALSAQVFPPVRTPRWDWSVCRELFRFGTHVTISRLPRHSSCTARRS